MKNNQVFDYRIFDRLIAKEVCFALYRLPGQQKINLILQQTTHCITAKVIKELDKHKGFVIAPFCIETNNPLVIIQPEVVLHSEAAIFDYLNNNISDLGNTEKITHDNNIPSDNNTFEIYTENYLKFHAAIENGEHQKLVLSRSVNYNRDEKFSEGIVFKKATEKYPDAFIYMCHTPPSGTWLGCTPELLLSEHNQEFKTVALAGTMPLSDSEIEWDKKNLDEQQIVTNYIQKQLESLGIVYINSNTQTVQAGNIAHLKTDFVFRKGNTNTGDLLDILHPTPAVCGFPKQESIRFINTNESYKRQYYSGFIGPLNMDKETDIYVNLRCMKITPRFMTLYAGGGILKSSDMIKEWLETESKLQTILSLIND